MSQKKCKHCKNRKNRTLMVQCDVNNDVYFCCNGCKQVHLLLNNRIEQKRDRPTKGFISKLKKAVIDIIKR